MSQDAQRTPAQVYPVEASVCALLQHWPLGNRGTIALWEQGSFRAGRRRQVPTSEDQLASVGFLPAPFLLC